MPVLDNSEMFGDCSETTEEMTVDSRDSKDPHNTNDLTDDQNHPNDSPRSHNSTDNTDIEMATDMNRHEALSECSRDADDHVKESPPRPESSLKSLEPPQSPVAEEAVSLARLDEASARATPSPSTELKAEPEDSPKVSGRNEDDEEATSSPPSVSPSNVMPRLRLNALLASDPALKPDAKDLKAVHEESQAQQNRLAAQLSGPPALTKHDDIVDAVNLVEPVLKPTPPPPPVEIPRMKVFMCMPCGIGFSSPSTLEAHQAYYCSHRNKDLDEESSAATLADKSAGTAAGASSNASATPLGNASNAGAGVVGEPAAKAIKTGKQYACTQCSYSADKKVSLNRHMRMHQTSPPPIASNGGGVGGGGIGAIGSAGAVGTMDESSSQQIDRYCSDCDIRFNNVKTYRAHKMHYCSSRRNDGQLTPKLEVSTPNSTKNIGSTASVVVGSGGISPQARTKTPTPAMVAAAAAAAAATLQQPPTQPFLALPTNPILIIPYSLIRSASLIPGPLNAATPGVTNPEGTCFTLTNGSLKPLATSLNLNSLNANAAAALPTPPNNQLQLGESPRQQLQQQQQQQQHLANNDSMLTDKNASRSHEVAEGTPQTPKRKEGATRESAPLDLSLRRSPIAAILQRQQRLRSSSAAGLDAEHQRLEMDSLLEGKENLSLDDSGSITPEHIVCAPSLPNSPSMSPSPKRRAISPRSSGAGSTSSMSPPAPNVTTASLAAAAAASNMLDNLPLRSMLQADLALQLSDSANLMSPLLAKKNLELMLKLSAAAAAAANSSAGGSVPQSTTPTPAELAAAAVAAAGKPSMLGLPGVLPGAASANAATAQPQIYVKQGVSKCKECNIVFCKYENYLAHKQHYCSARNQEPSSDSEPKVSNTPPMVAAASTAETTPVAYQQLICAACGIKYTSLDNLRAHQNYYCPKGGAAMAAAAAAAAAAANSMADQMQLPKEKCGKCKTLHEVGLACPPPVTLQPPLPPQQPQQSPSAGSHQNVYKCPVCDAVSMTASESRKHMETHGTVKAFRCSICRYKGNTLRGMRTHIRMHFDKKSCDFNEEHYMSCILEDEGIEIPSAATVQQQQQLQQAAAVVASLQSQQQQQQQQQQQVFNCDLCNYSSSYKGNVLRHMKSVHPHVPINSPSISPDAGEMDISDAASMSSSLNGDGGHHSTTIKTEPLESNSAPISNSFLHDNNSSPTLSHPHANDLLITHIKSEPLDPMDSRASPLLPPPPLTSRRSAVLGTATPPPPPTLPTATVVVAQSQAPPPLNSSAAGDDNNLAAAAMNAKYCQTCDISFNYTKTYLAHKQYYCKNKIRLPESGRNEDSSSPNTAVGNLMLAAMPGSPSNALLLQKNKENLQQEAAI